MKLHDKNIIVIGGKGMLGSDIIDGLGNIGAKVQAADLPELDITDKDQLAEAVKGYDVIVNCAAYTDVERAEAESKIATAVNGDAVGVLGDIAKKAGAKVVHISTDFVFDGTGEEPWCETDKTNPINAYGASKLEGEKQLLEALPQACIVRVEWTYGKNGNNFVRKMLELAEKYSTLKVVSDQVGGPTATTEAAKAIIEILDDVPEGIFHFAASGYASRDEMAKFIFEKCGKNITVEKCGSDEYKTAAKRPLNSRFNTEKIQRILKSPIRQWDHVLGEYLERM